MIKKIATSLLVCLTVILSLCHGQGLPQSIPSNLYSSGTLTGTNRYFFTGTFSGTSAGTWGLSPKLEMTPVTTSTSGTGPVKQVSYYQMTFSASASPSAYYAAIFSKGISMLPNRNYTLSLIVAHDYSNLLSEIDIGIRTKQGTISVYSSTVVSGTTTLVLTSTKVNDYNSDGILNQDVNGIRGNHNASGTIPPSDPNYEGTVNTWTRWDFTFTSLPFTGTGYLQIQPRFRGTTGTGMPGNAAPTLRIADACLIEEPAVTYSGTVPPPVTFAGSAGKFQPVSGTVKPSEMGITSAAYNSGSTAYVVKTSGATFAFTFAANYITIKDNLTTGEYRAIVRFPSGFFTGLAPSGTSDPYYNPNQVRVMENDKVKIGIQGDSMLMITPKFTGTIEVEARKGGEWNRFFAGNLYSVDKDGGFCVNPIIPLGSGATSQYKPTVIPTQYFFDKYNETETVFSGTDVNWRVSYTVPFGERLAVGTFPPRKFDWEKSFSSNYAVVSYSETASENSIGTKMDGLKKAGVDVVVLFDDFFTGGWAAGGECGSKHLLRNVARFQTYVKKAVDNGLKPLLYFSPKFYSDSDMNTFFDDVKTVVNSGSTSSIYKLDGVYYDGTPFDCLSTYQLMRKTRDFFPEGTVILHSSVSAPCFVPDILSPFIDTYADITLRGETVPAPLVKDGHGGTLNYSSKNWPFPKWAGAQYNVANCIGVFKGSQWNLSIPNEIKGDYITIKHPLYQAEGRQDLAHALILLKYGGRGRYLAYNEDTSKPGVDPFVDGLDDWTNVYYPILKAGCFLGQDATAEERTLFWNEVRDGVLKDLYSAWVLDGNHPDFFEDTYRSTVEDLTEELLKDIP